MTRKTAVTSFVLLCALALAIPASAQVSFNVTSSAQTVRTEGITETAGSVNMNWASGNQISPGSSITLTYATATVYGGSPYVTAKINGTACTPLQNTVAATGTCTGMSVTSSGASVVISFIGTTTPPGAGVFFTTGDYIQVAQTRLNVAAVTGAQPVSGTTALFATISGNSPSANTVTFNQNQVQVASISSSLNVSKSGASASNIQTCSVTASTFAIQVAEIFPAAITSLTDETNFTPNLVPLPTGTTLNFVFTNVPPGIVIGASSPFPNALAGFTVGSVTAPVTSTSATASYTITATVTATASGSVEKPIFTFTIGAGSGVTSITPLANNGLANPSTITAQVYLGPVTTTATTVVRFTQLNYPATAFGVGSVSDCVTNLLFPYHNASNGFDTSYAIANTTEDDFVFGAGLGAKAVPGTCKLTLFTSDLAGNATGTATLTTPTIPAAGVIAFSSASGGGGVASNTALNGQAGYVIAVCNFLNAHGYALVTNGNASVVPTGQQYATGYLGLVLTPVGPGTVGGGGAFPIRGLNEQLGH